MPPNRSENGQASVELAAVVPFVLLATLAVAQLALVGFALWTAGAGARAGAREALVGGNGKRAAVAAVPEPFRADAQLDGMRVRLSVRPPSLIPGVRMPPLRSSARLAPTAGPEASDG